MVVWGQNTVHTYPSAPTPAPGMSAAAPASSFTFGGGGAAPSSSGGGGLFGGAAPASTAAPPLFGGGGGFFGSSSSNSTPAPAAFGSTATTGGLFGGFSSAAPTGGGGLFGTTTPAPMQQPPPPQIPAHAALRAHLDASARNEHARVCHKMTRLYEAYTTGGTVPPDEDDDDSMDNNNGRRSRSHCFSTILYNPATPQQLQFAAAVAASVGGSSSATSSTSLATFGPLEPKPAPLSSHDWRWAWIRNPDPSRYVPLVVTGADALAARALAHPDQATAQWQQGWDPLHTTVTVLAQRHARLRAQLATQQVRHAQQVRRLWKILSHVEVARCYHVQTTEAEYQGAQRVQHLLRHVVEQELEPAVTQLLLPLPRNESTTHTRWTQRHRDDNDDDTPSPEHQEKWKELLTQHRAQLQTLTEMVARDQHDLALIRDRVLGSDPQQQQQAPLHPAQAQQHQYPLRY